MGTHESARANTKSAQHENGSYIGDYKVIKHLASGGMADVYLVADDNGNTRALKCLREKNAYDPEYVLMFVDEAKLMSELDHPNVVRAVDVSRAETDGFFVMEYVHGATLLRTLSRAIHTRGALRLDLAVSVLLRVAAGLHHAHELCNARGESRSVVHRDLSMANVLIGFDGSVKVADFGVAHASDRELETGENLIKGKVGYMSPEQCLGKPLDRRSDVFALGILLYEATTGTRLFGGKTDYEKLTKLVRGRIAPPTTVDRYYPPQLETVVMRALARDPNDRYASALEFLTALSEVRDGGLATSTAELATMMQALFQGEDVAPPPTIEVPDTQIMAAPPTFAPRAARGSTPEIFALGTLPPVEEPIELDAFFGSDQVTPRTGALRLDSADFLVHEASRRLCAGRYQAAMAGFAEILDHSPGNLTARAGYYVARACQARVGGRGETASRYLRMAVDVAPTHTDAPYWDVVLQTADEQLLDELRAKTHATRAN